MWSFDSSLWWGPYCYVNIGLVIVVVEGSPGVFMWLRDFSKSAFPSRVVTINFRPNTGEATAPSGVVLDFAKRSLFFGRETLPWCYSRDPSSIPAIYVPLVSVIVMEVSA
jgi:hypothetical protein